MNFGDLLVVVAIGSGLFGLLMAVSKQEQFLLKAVNPHRVTWLVAAISIVWVGLSIMRLEAGNWDLHTWLRLFFALISEEKAPVQVKVASLALFFGALLVGMVGICVFFYPRDPSTFSGPDDRKAAFRYYVSGLRGGLDFALLGSGDGEILLEETDGRKIANWGSHLPKVLPDVTVPQPITVVGGNEITGGSNPDCPRLRIRTITDQVNFWRRCAKTIHEKRRELEGLFGIAHQGHNWEFMVDTEFGGLFFRYIRLPDPSVEGDPGLYVFAATLNQSEIDNGRAYQHFKMLLEALRNIDKAIRAD